MVALAVVCALMVMAVCSCGGGPDAEELLREALNRSGEASTLRAEVQAVAEPREGSNIPPISLEGTLELDREGRSLQLQFSSFVMEGELRVVEGTPYLQVGGRWYTLPGDEASTGLVRYISEAIFSYPDIIAEYAAVRSEGSEKVGGRKCRRLAVSPDLARLSELEAFREAGKSLGVPREGLLSELQEMAPALKVWVDESDHFIRKLELALDLDLSQGMLFMGMMRGRVTVRLTAFFNDYGQPLEIEPPPEAQPFDLGGFPFFS